MALQTSITKFQAIPLSRKPTKIVVRWELDTTDGEILKDYEIYVMRAGAQDMIPQFQNIGMMTRKPVTPEQVEVDAKNLVYVSRGLSALDFPWYLDYAPLLGMLAQPLWYKLALRRISTQETVETPAFTFDGELDVVGLYVVEEHNFLLEDVIGAPTLVYQRKRGGLRCTCVDPIQQKRTSSRCHRCFGTGWIGGFYNPISCYVDYAPNPKLVDITPWGELQPNNTQVLMSNFPTVSPGDLLRELREDRIWRVVQVVETEKRRVPMLQFVRVEEVKPGDIEYSIPKDERFVVQKIQELEAIKLKREF